MASSAARTGPIEVAVNLIVLTIAGRASDFRSAVLLAANLGDDADTVAAIAGQLAGAIYGLAGIPAEWWQRIAWYDRLESAAIRLADDS